MNEKRMKNALEAIARRNVPENINLWPNISARLDERKSLMMTLRARPILLILAILLALTLLTGVAYAIGRLTGFIPGIGFVDTSALRVLAEPVSVTRDGITVSIEQVVVDSERTVIVYKTEGLTIEAANSKGEGGGPFGSEHLLRLSDETILKEQADAGYGGTPEPLINQVQTEGGWPNYVWRLVYPSVPPDVNELTLIIPVLQNMPVGAAPENWEITFRLKPAPPEMTFAPFFQFTPHVEGTGTPSLDATGSASPANISSHDGFTLQLDHVIETQNGFVFTGDTFWDIALYPPGKVSVDWEMVLTLTDASGQKIPIEPVQVDAPYVEGHRPWSYATDRKAFTGPLTLSIPSIQATYFVPSLDFAVDLGPNPQIGQMWELNHDFQIEGHTLRLVSITMKEAFTSLDPQSGPGCKPDVAALDFSFTVNQAGIGALVNDTVSDPTPVPGQCIYGGGGGGGGPNEPTSDPTKFSTGINYQEIPKGTHRFSLVASIPKVITGPWQVQWNPPLSSEPTPTPEPGACLNLNKWNQIMGRNDALPSGVGGKIVRTINEGGPLPAIYVSNPDGSNLQKIGIGAWPSLSNNGTQLVYSALNGLRVVNLTTGQSTAFGVDGYRIIWSPDDTRMMFTNTFNIYVVNADGSGLQRINIPSGQVFAPVGWLPDNQTVVYSTLSGDGFVLKTYNLQSGEMKGLFTIHNKAGYGAISPDGQWIVFADREFGETNWGIFISRLDGLERKMVAEPEVPTAFTSVWGPDGQWLIVNTRDANDKNIPVLVNPFTCQTVALNQVSGMVEGWSR